MGLNDGKYLALHKTEAKHKLYELDKYQWLEFNGISINLMYDVFKERMENWDFKEIEGSK